MMIYRLNIWRNEKMLGHFQSATPWSREAVQDVAGRLPDTEGYRIEVLVARQDRRLVESGPGGVRLVSSEPIFEATTLDA